MKYLLVGGIEERKNRQKGIKGTMVFLIKMTRFNGPRKLKTLNVLISCTGSLLMNLLYK